MGLGLPGAVHHPMLCPEPQSPGPTWPREASSSISIWRRTSSPASSRRADSCVSGRPNRGQATGEEVNAWWVPTVRLAGGGKGVRGGKQMEEQSREAAWAGRGRRGQQEERARPVAKGGARPPYGARAACSVPTRRAGAALPQRPERRRFCTLQPAAEAPSPPLLTRGVLNRRSQIQSPLTPDRQRYELVCHGTGSDGLAARLLAPRPAA